MRALGGTVGRGLHRRAIGAVDEAADDELLHDDAAEGPDDRLAEGFSELYRAHHEDIRRLCTAILHDPSEAEDATEEAFTKAWRALLDGRSGAESYPWLRVVARNHCYDVLRRTGRARPVEDAALEAATPPIDGCDGEVLDGVVIELARESVRRVAPSHRSILALREGLELSYQEIADHEAIPLASVESRLYRARRALRREYLALVGPEGVAAGIWWRIHLRFSDGCLMASQTTTALCERATPPSCSGPAGAAGAAVITAAAAVVGLGHGRVPPQLVPAAPTTTAVQPAAASTITALSGATTAHSLGSARPQASTGRRGLVHSGGGHRSRSSSAASSSGTRFIGTVNSATIWDPPVTTVPAPTESAPAVTAVASADGTTSPVPGATEPTAPSAPAPAADTATTETSPKVASAAENLAVESAIAPAADVAGATEGSTPARNHGRHSGGLGDAAGTATASTPTATVSAAVNSATPVAAATLSASGPATGWGNAAAPSGVAASHPQRTVGKFSSAVGRDEGHGRGRGSAAWAVATSTAGSATSSAATPQTAASPVAATSTTPPPGAPPASQPAATTPPSGTSSTTGPGWSAQGGSTSYSWTGNGWGNPNGGAGGWGSPGRGNGNGNRGWGY